MQHLISICEVREITPEMIARNAAGPNALNPQVSQQEQRIAQLEKLVEAMAASANVNVDELLNQEEPEKEPLMDYREMDMASIRKLAKSLGVVAERTDNKEQIIEKIEAYGKDTPELDERGSEAQPTPETGRAFSVAV
jgi:hypothetical protein